MPYVKSSSTCPISWPIPCVPLMLCVLCFEECKQKGTRQLSVQFHVKSLAYVPNYKQNGAQKPYFRQQQQQHSVRRNAFVTRLHSEHELVGSGVIISAIQNAWEMNEVIYQCATGIMDGFWRTDFLMPLWIECGLQFSCCQELFRPEERITTMRQSNSWLRALWNQNRHLHDEWNTVPLRIIDVKLNTSVSECL